jgi:NAD(P)-dependent dehydrogenase (short-subunit alcohol dehydrogenase family)
LDSNGAKSELNQPPATQKQTVLVTGCSSGFGEIIVKTLAAEGHTVYATMRDVAGRNAPAAQALQDWAMAQNATVIVLELDVSDDASVAAAVAFILEKGPLDVVVNNAGIAAGGPLEAFSGEQVQALYDVNVFGPLRVDRAVLPQMRQRRSGLLIHVSSTLGRVLPGGGGLYPASKWALEGLIESLYYQVRPFDIDVVILEPGAFPTPAVVRGMEPAYQAVVEDYARLPQRNQRQRSEPGPDYKYPDLQEMGDAVKQVIDLPQGNRPLRRVVGPIFTEGVEEYNQQYEALKQHLAQVLQRPDQATPWTRRPAPSR